MRPARRPPAREPDIHIVPLHDLIEHDTVVQCLCRPAIEDYGPAVARVVLHYAYDGREYRKPDGPVAPAPGRPN